MKLKYVLFSTVLAGSLILGACGNDKATQEAETQRIADSIRVADSIATSEAESARLAEEANNAEAARLAEEEAKNTKGGSKKTSTNKTSTKIDVKESGVQKVESGATQGTGSKTAVKTSVAKGIPSNNTADTKAKIETSTTEDAKPAGVKGNAGTQKARP